MRTYILLILLALTARTSAQQQNVTPVEVIYVYDALCGWCYGFSDAIQSFQKAHPDVNVTVIAGGMITGERVGPLIEVAPYIRSAYKDVENATGVKFGQPFLNELFGDADMIMTSNPSARALETMKVLAPNVPQVQFAAALQKMVYHDGKQPGDESALADVAASFDIDRDAFLEYYASDRAAKAADANMALSNQLGVTGFPTVFVKTGEELRVISRGYMPLERLEANFTEAVN